MGWILKKHTDNSNNIDECLYNIHIKETTPPKGIGKVEERDYTYSKLFIFLSLIRSTILTTTTSKEIIKLYIKDIIQIYHKYDYIKDGIISSLILFLEEGCDDDDISTLIQNDILFNNEENKNEWNINELSLGIYVYHHHNHKTDKRMKIFNIN